MTCWPTGVRCREHRNHVITAAVRDGACTLSIARRVLEQTGTVAKILPTATREEIQSCFLQLDPSMGARGVEELTRILRARFEPEVLEADDAHLEEVEATAAGHGCAYGGSFGRLDTDDTTGRHDDKTDNAARVAGRCRCRDHHHR